MGTEPLSTESEREGVAAVAAVLDLPCPEAARQPALTAARGQPAPIPPGSSPHAQHALKEGLLRATLLLPGVEIPLPCAREV